MMTSSAQHRIGLAIDEWDTSVAVWTALEPEVNIKFFRLQNAPGAALAVEPGFAPRSLPVALSAGRTWNTGEDYWFEQWLTHLRHRWWPTLKLPDAALLLSLPSAISSRSLQRLRQTARRCGWEACQIATHDLCLAAWHLRTAAEPATVLVLCQGADETTLSLATGFQGVVRLRDRVQTRALSQLCVDEVILAAIAANFPPTTDREVWARRWRVAANARHELDGSAAAVVELAEPDWGVNAGVELDRDELGCALEGGIRGVIAAARALSDRNGVTLDASCQLIVSGSGPFRWPATFELLREMTGAQLRIDSLAGAACGAALMAEHLEDSPVEIEELPQTEWHRQWLLDGPQGRQPSVQFRARVVEELPATIRARNPMQQAKSAAATANLDPSPVPIEALWHYLLGVASENPQRARALVSELVLRAESFLSALERGTLIPVPPERPPAAKIDPRIELARLALNSGNPEEAIREAHQAQANTPEDPAVFRQMIDVHVEAADKTTDHEQAIAWLKCAHAHDQSNRAVHRRIAERYRRQAESQQQAGDGTAARRSLEDSLVWEPFNEEAQRMIQSFLGRF
jgi:hypothetical protein